MAWVAGLGAAELFPAGVLPRSLFAAGLGMTWARNAFFFFSQMHTYPKTPSANRKSLFAHKPKRFFMEGRPFRRERKPREEARGKKRTREQNLGISAKWSSCPMRRASIRRPSLRAHSAAALAAAGISNSRNPRNFDRIEGGSVVLPLFLGVAVCCDCVLLVFGIHPCILVFCPFCCVLYIPEQTQP